MQCIVVKSDEFENSLPLYIFPLNPDYVAARSLRSLCSKNNILLCISLQYFFPTKSTIYHEEMAMVIFPHVKITCYLHVFLHKSSPGISLMFIAKEQPLKDTRLRGGSLIQPCAIVPGAEKSRIDVTVIMVM